MADSSGTDTAAGAARALYEQFVSDGVERVRHAITRNESETQFLDFKESRDKQGRQSAILTDSGQENLGKAISAFANTSGGVIVWGVMSKDRRANGDSPIPDVSTFVQDLNTATARMADPPVVGVVHHPIYLEDGTSGYAVTYIPESRHKPHQCVTHEGVTNYYMRSGASIKAMPHAFVRALFAERAKAELQIEYPLVNEAVFGILRYQDGKPIRQSQNFFEVGMPFFLKNKGEAIAKHAAVGLAVFPGHKLLRFEPSNLMHTGTMAMVPTDDGMQSVMLYSVVQGHVIYPGTNLYIGHLWVSIYDPHNLPKLTVKTAILSESQAKCKEFELPMDGVTIPPALLEDWDKRHPRR